MKRLKTNGWVTTTLDVIKLKQANILGTSQISDKSVVVGCNTQEC